jgi:exopolysaccharide biosynthesis polyprenyl glycosylphosphotransferase
MNRRNIQSLVYLLSDFLMSYGVWLVFVLLRRHVLENREPVLEAQQFVNAAVIGIYWIVIYASAGLYAEPFRRSRLKEISLVFQFTLIGVLIVFFMVFLDDPVPRYKTHRQFTLPVFLSLQFFSVALARLIITSRTNIRIRKRKMGYPTVLVGCGERAFHIFDELDNMQRSLGYMFMGYVSLPEEENNLLSGKLKRFGDVQRLDHVIRSRRIEEVIIALDGLHSERVGDVIEICERTNVNIKVVPGIYDYIIGSVKISHILGAPLIEIIPQAMGTWEAVGKRIFDFCFALGALIFLSPVFIFLAIMVRLDSKGPFFFSQERIGKGGKPFRIFKFRSMYIDAEKDGPALSREGDPRVTRVGKWLRKLRLDELPQFWNVLIGDMSIVGPRPERQFFIDQIVKRAPHYRHLHKIRPGITSWGQVKYGYAENVDEMIERLKFDIVYLESVSFTLDLRIILYTIIVMIEGRGK